MAEWLGNVVQAGFSSGQPRLGSQGSPLVEVTLVPVRATAEQGPRGWDRGADWTELSGTGAKRWNWARARPLKGLITGLDKRRVRVRARSADELGPSSISLRQFLKVLSSQPLDSGQSPLVGWLAVSSTSRIWRAKLERYEKVYKWLTNVILLSDACVCDRAVSIQLVRSLVEFEFGISSTSKAETYSILNLDIFE